MICAFICSVFLIAVFIEKDERTHVTTRYNVHNPIDFFMISINIIINLRALNGFESMRFNVDRRPKGIDDVAFSKLSRLLWMCLWSEGFIA